MTTTEETNNYLARSERKGDRLNYCWQLVCSGQISDDKQIAHMSDTSV